MDKENDGEMISKLIAFHDCLEKMIQESFSGNDKFQQTQKEAMSTALNKRQSKPAELVAIFIDK